MAEIKQRSAGEAGWAYDVGGKTYYTAREAQRAAAAIDNAQAQQQTQANTTTSDTAQRVVEDTSQMTMNGQPFDEAVTGGGSAWSAPEPVSRPTDWKGNGTVIERNSDGTATINFAGGGQHTVSGGNAVKALQDAYGITEVVSSGISSSAQKQLRDNTWNAYNEYVGAKNAAEKLNARDKILSDANVNLTQEQVQEIINRNGSAGNAASHPSNKSAIKNAILGMAMGLSFDEATDMSSDGGFYTMLRQGYSTDEWNKSTSQLTADDLQTIGGKLKYLQSTLNGLTYGVVGSNMDTRDWGAAVTSGNAIKGLQVATNQMYGGVRVAYMSPGYEKDENGEDILDKPLPKTPYLVGGNGSILTGPGNSTMSIYDNMRTFGVRDLSWAPQFIDSLGDYSSNNRLKLVANGINTLSSNWDSYWKGSEYLWDMNLASMYEIPKKKVEPPKEQQPAGMTQAGVPVTEVPVTPPTYGTQQTGGTTTYQNGIATTTTTPSVGSTASGTYPQSTTTGTFNVPLQSSGLSAVPTSVTVASQPGGYTQEQLTRTTPGMGGMAAGVRTVNYTNAFGQSIPVTESNGTPITYVPPGYTRGDRSTAQQGMQAATPAGTMTAGSSTGTAGPGVMGGGRGTGSTPYSGPMSGGPLSGNPNAPRPSLSQLSSNQELVIGPDGWYVRSAMAKGGYMGSGYASGGMSQDKMLEAKYRIAQINGYNGPKTNTALNAFANSSPGMSAKFNAIGAALAKGGYMRKGYDNGGLEDGSEPFSLAPGTTVGETRTDPASGATYKWNGTAWEFQGQDTPVEVPAMQQQMQSLVGQTMQPIQAPIAMIQPTAEDFVPNTAGMAAPVAPFAEAATVPTAAQAGMPVMTPASVMQAASVSPAVQESMDQFQGAQGTLSQQAQAQAAQQGVSSVSDLQAAQGTAYLMQNPVQRQIQQGELISGAANAQTAAAFTEQVQAATATPSKQATVAGQLENLMAQFEGGNRPAWAAASMRNAMGVLAARGLGASSLAGQAVIQATMEAALPIAQMDAQTQAQFESQNLSNRQQRAMLAAQQRAEFLGMEFTQEFQARVQNSARIGDIANMNFTAEQQIALENSRAVNTMNLNNLNNSQALVMAEAAALSQLDMQNLNNRQQAAVQNAQNFLQMDMQNLSNNQQTALFKAQQNVQALFTDQAAENATRQFNAANENQTNQFFANMSTQTSQFNASQQNAMDQFNVNSVNALREFNAQQQAQRDMFNAQNGLVIAQANAQWRQNIASVNTAMQNQSNMDFAKTINALTSTNLDQIWQRERDIMSFAFTSSESAQDRALKIVLGNKELEQVRMQLDAQEKAAKGSLFTRFLFGSGGAGGGGLLGKLIPGLG